MDEHAEIVWTKQSPDGRRRVDLLARNDGLFESREDVLTLYDHPPAPEEV